MKKINSLFLMLTICFSWNVFAAGPWTFAGDKLNKITFSPVFQNNKFGEYSIESSFLSQVNLLLTLGKKVVLSGKYDSSTDTLEVKVSQGSVTHSQNFGGIKRNVGLSQTPVLSHLNMSIVSNGSNRSISLGKSYGVTITKVPGSLIVTDIGTTIPNVQSVPTPQLPFVTTSTVNTVTGTSIVGPLRLSPVFKQNNISGQKAFGEYAIGVEQLAAINNAMKKAPVILIGSYRSGQDTFTMQAICQGYTLFNNVLSEIKSNVKVATSGPLQLNNLNYSIKTSSASKQIDVGAIGAELEISEGSIQVKTISGLTPTTSHTSGVQGGFTDIKLATEEKVTDVEVGVFMTIQENEYSGVVNLSDLKLSSSTAQSYIDQINTALKSGKVVIKAEPFVNSSTNKYDLNIIALNASGTQLFKATQPSFTIKEYVGSEVLHSGPAASTATVKEVNLGYQTNNLKETKLFSESNSQLMFVVDPDLIIAGTIKLPPAPDQRRVSGGTDFYG